MPVLIAVILIIIDIPEDIIKEIFAMAHPHPDFVIGAQYAPPAGFCLAFIVRLRFRDKRFFELIQLPALLIQFVGNLFIADFLFPCQDFPQE